MGGRVADDGITDVELLRGVLPRHSDGLQDLSTGKHRVRLVGRDIKRSDWKSSLVGDCLGGSRPISAISLKAMYDITEQQLEVGRVGKQLQ